MKDRTPTYPGRVKLTPVSGQANTYDMVRADSPTQEGTPLNKDTLLKDTTAASLGLMGDPTVDEAFAKAANKFSELSAAIAAGTKIATGSYVGTGTYGSSNPCSLTFDFEPKIVIVNASDVGLFPGTYGGWGNGSGFLFTGNQTSFRYTSGGSSRTGECSLVGNTLTWYLNNVGDYDSAATQLNNINTSYHWVAIG